MKKVSILLLLTVVLASFSFAQISVTGGFEIGNITEGSEGKSDPALWTAFEGSASKELGPGSIGAAFGLGTKLHFAKEYGWKSEPAEIFGSDYATDGLYTDAGDIYLKGTYTLPAGPGELGLGVSTWQDFGALNFDVGYDGITAGPVTLGFGITYALNTSGKTLDEDKAFASENAVFGDDVKAKDDDGKDIVGSKTDDFTARLSAAFDFGLSLTYKFTFGIDHDSKVATIAYVDVNYKVIDPLTVGLELDKTGPAFKGAEYDLANKAGKRETYSQGFTLKPYVKYAITENTSVGLNVKIAGIGNDFGDIETPNDEDYGDVLITPGLTISHTF
jgi:hypothetical protein